MSTVLEPLRAPSVSDEEGLRREVLLRAAELIERDGWTTGCKGMCVQPGARHCILGAIAHAMTAFNIQVKSSIAPTFIADNDISMELYDMEIAANFAGINGEKAYGWNDDLMSTTWELGSPSAAQTATNLRRLANGERLFV